MLDRPKVWVLFACSIADGGAGRPPAALAGRLVPRLVERDELPAAGALSSFRMTIGMVAGPAIGGVLIATVGPAADLRRGRRHLPVLAGHAAADAGGAAAARRRAAVAAPDHGGRALRRSRPDLLGTYIVDIIAMFFGMPMALFPAIADGLRRRRRAGPALRRAQRRLADGDRVQRLDGEVQPARARDLPGRGRLGGGHRRLRPGGHPVGRPGRSWPSPARRDMISGLFRSVIWNSTIPDELRGRLAGIEQVSYSTGPLLGNVESGVAASLVGVRAAVVSGGMLCVVGRGRHGGRAARLLALPTPAAPGSGVDHPPEGEHRRRQRDRADRPARRRSRP